MDLDLGPHAITAVLERDQIRLRLVCPGAPLCKSYLGCSEECAYGSTWDDDDQEITCPGCNGLGHNGQICGLSDWFDNIAPEEMFEGCDVDLAGLTFPISIRVLYWHSDEGPCWDVIRPDDEGAIMTGVGLIGDERRRQVIEEGWTPEHDDQYVHGELRTAAWLYARWAGTGDIVAGTFAAGQFPPDAWPFHHSAEKPSWKPTRLGNDLIKAGALIAAELDRLQRAGWRP